MDKVRAEAKFQDEPYDPQSRDVEAIQLAAGGKGSSIPEALDEEEEERDRDGVKILLQKYSKVFKFLFNKYAMSRA